MKLVARTLSGLASAIEIDGPVFQSIVPLRSDSPDLPWIAPGLVDLQVNGFAGIDFNRALESDDAWQHATHQLYAYGCTSFLIALITNREEASRDLLTGLSQRIARRPRNCLGFHLEGPWLNPGPGTRGAHRPEWMQPATPRLLDDWRSLVGDLLKLVTLAPEIETAAALDVIRAGVGHRIAFFLGHSEAIGDTLQRAVDAGAVGWTHLGNAVPATVPKFDNVILHVLAQSGLRASLIPDGLHLPPHAFRALAQSLARATPSRLLLTTDAMAGAAAPPGTYTLGEVVVRVGADGAARLPDSGRLAGSTLTPFAGVLRAQKMAALGLEATWNAFSRHPASLLGLDHEILAGNSADFCLLSPEKEPRLLSTWHCGQCVYAAP